jgi:uncharacterized membrane protein
VHRVFATVEVLISSVRPFMVWNLLLAAVPVLIAVPLFGIVRWRRHTLLWWAAFAVWLTFLPNAPYVITDVIHLVDDVQHAHDMHAYAILACYGAFIGLGLVSYTGSLWLFRRWLATTTAARFDLVAVGLLHAMCAAAIYLGRFVRLNSWDVVMAPEAVLASFRHLVGRVPVGVLALTFAALVASSFVIQTVGERVVVLAARSRRQTSAT